MPPMLTSVFLGAMPPNSTINLVCLAIVGQEVTVPATGSMVPTMCGTITDAAPKLSLVTWLTAQNC